MIGETLGHYRIVKRLGAGGMGEVYLAEDLKLGRQVALKVLPERFAASSERLERFRREASALAALDHPGIVTVYSIESEILDRRLSAGRRAGSLKSGSVGTEEPVEIQFLTMQYVRGRPLSQLIPKRGLSLERFLPLAVPLADAICAAHEKGIVHRDLKPTNIMVADDGRIKVLDFGLVKLLQAEPGEVELDATTDPLTGSGQIPGTLPYMSPEQIRGGHTDYRSDIFSLGVVLYQMATGEYPFRRTSKADLASSILRDTPRPVTEVRPDLPDQLAWILNLCLQKKPDKRMQSVKELRNEIEYLEQETSAASDESAELVLEKKRSRRLGWLLTGVAALSIVLAGALVWRLVTVPKGEAQPPRFFEVVPVPSFAGPGEGFNAVGMSRFLESRLQGLRGTYLAYADEIAPLADYRLEIDARKEAGLVNLSYRLLERSSGRFLGGDILASQPGELGGLTDEVGEAIAELLRGEGIQSLRFRPAVAASSDAVALESFIQGLDRLAKAAGPGDLTAAEEALAAAWSRDPSFQWARVFDGLALQRLFLEQREPEFLERSAELCAAAVEAEPQLALGQVCLGHAARLGRDLLAAIERYRESIELGLRHPEAYRGARAAFISLGRPESEERFWEEVIETDPRYWLGFTYRADIRLEQGHHEAALADALRAVELGPNDPGVYLTLWNVQHEMGRHGEALLTLERGLEIDPEDYRLWGNLGNTYFHLRRFEEAIEAHSRTAQLEPGDYRAHGHLGRDYYWAAGRRAEARPHLERAVAMCLEELEADPTKSDARLMLAWYQAMLGDAEASRQTLAAALDQRPNNTHYLYVAGLVTALLNDRETALDYFERALAGGWSISDLQTSIEVDSLREEPRFRELMNQQNEIRGVR